MRACRWGEPGRRAYGIEAPFSLRLAGTCGTRLRLGGAGRGGLRLRVVLNEGLIAKNLVTIRELEAIIAKAEAVIAIAHRT